MLIALRKLRYRHRYLSWVHIEVHWDLTRGFPKWMGSRYPLPSTKRKQTTNIHQFEVIVRVLDIYLHILWPCWIFQQSPHCWQENKPETSFTDLSQRREGASRHLSPYGWWRFTSVPPKMDHPKRKGPYSFPIHFQVLCICYVSFRGRGTSQTLKIIESSGRWLGCVSGWLWESTVQWLRTLNGPWPRWRRFA